MLVEIIGKCLNGDGKPGYKSNFSSKSPFLCLRRCSKAAYAIFSKKLSHYQFLPSPRCSVTSDSISQIIIKFSFLLLITFISKCILNLP